MKPKLIHNNKTAFIFHEPGDTKFQVVIAEKGKDDEVFEVNSDTEEKSARLLKRFLNENKIRNRKIAHPGLLQTDRLPRPMLPFPDQKAIKKGKVWTKAERKRMNRKRK